MERNSIDREGNKITRGFWGENKSKRHEGGRREGSGNGRPRDADSERESERVRKEGRWDYCMTE